VAPPQRWVDTTDAVGFDATILTAPKADET
jgi:hypothetical protein